MSLLASKLKEIRVTWSQVKRLCKSKKAEIRKVVIIKAVPNLQSYLKKEKIN